MRATTSPAPDSLATATRAAVVRQPAALAVVDGEIRWTWADLDARAAAMAEAVSDARAEARATSPVRARDSARDDARVQDGAHARVGTPTPAPTDPPPGGVVALLAEPSAAAIAAIHGIRRTGALLAPLPTNRTASELAAAVAILDPAVVVCDDAGEAPWSLLGRPTLRLGDLVPAGQSPPVETRVAIDPAATVEPPPAVAILTSGTTGRVRIALLSDAALAASARAWLAALPASTGWLLALGLGHVAGLGVLWRAALARVPLVVLRRPSATDILDALMADPSPSHVSLVPTQLARVLDAAADRHPPGSVRAVLLGGGPVPPGLVRRALDAGWPVVPTYGLTEAGSGVTAAVPGAAGRHPGTAGAALPGVRVRIGEADETGAGEILVHSPARFAGYLRDPAATAAAIDEAGWLRTGDIGRLDAEGRLTVLDRRADRIVRGGENLSPIEVEEVLLAHPAVADAAVVARRDATWGQVPVAAIVLRGDAPDPGDAALEAHCRRRLAAFKVPAAFVRVATLPRTAGGKLRRAEVRAALERPRVAWLNAGSGPVHLLLLHGTLSSAAQLGGLSRALAASGTLTVHAVDRRGSGESRLERPEPLDVGAHVDDLVEVLDAEGCPAAVIVGVSFGGVVALEFAARMPSRTIAVVAWEPPYGPLADAATQRAFVAVAAATESAHRTGGRAAAAEVFLRGVSGDAAWESLPERTRAFLAAQGDGALVDAGLLGLDPDGLRGISAPVTILTGGASAPFYRPIADALRDRIPGASRGDLPGLSHSGPITDPVAVAAAVLEAVRAHVRSAPDVSG